MPIIGGGGGGGGSGSGTVLDYVALTSGTVNIIGTTDAGATTLITGSSITLDGSTSIIVEVFAPAWDTPNVATVGLTGVLYDGSTDLGRIITTRGNAAGDTIRTPVYAKQRLASPSAGAHQYIFKAFVSSGTGVFYGGASGAGVNMAAFIRVTIA